MKWTDAKIMQYNANIERIQSQNFDNTPPPSISHTWTITDIMGAQSAKFLRNVKKKIQAQGTVEGASGQGELRGSLLTSVTQHIQPLL